jgi:hypothetical protein
MHRIFILVLAFGILCSLCGCGEQSSSAVDSDYSSAGSQSVSTSVNDSDYQSYTVDDNGNILDSKTGGLITNDELALDNNGNIVLKDSGRVVVAYEQVLENKKSYNSSQTKNKKAENSSKPEKAASSSTSKISSSTISKPAVSSKPKSHREPISIEKLNHWDSLYGEKEWKLLNTDPSRQWYEGSNAFVCRFSAGQDSHAAISVECYCLLDEWKYPLNHDNDVRTMNGKKYVQIRWSGYQGDLYTFLGGEDQVTLELRCYDATGHHWLSDELKFKRTGNNSLKLISGDYQEFGLKNGDVFTR